jgi:hypothetical protein
MKAQSYISDQLTHFVGGGLPNDEQRYKLFKKILREGWLKASNRDELGPGIAMRSDGGKRLSTNEAITCTMLCFCDIPPEQFYIHIQKYGPFGLAFSKDALIRQGANPVHYVVRNARNRAIGAGVPTIGDRFDELRAELQRARFELEEYVRGIDGAPTYLSKLPPSSIPVGQKRIARTSTWNENGAYLTGYISVWKISPALSCRKIMRNAFVVTYQSTPVNCI